MNGVEKKENGDDDDDDDGYKNNWYEKFLLCKLYLGASCSVC